MLQSVCMVDTRMLHVMLSSDADLISFCSTVLELQMHHDCNELAYKSISCNHLVHV